MFAKYQPKCSIPSGFNFKVVWTFETCVSRNSREESHVINYTGDLMVCDYDWTLSVDHKIGYIQCTKIHTGNILDDKLSQQELCEDKSPELADLCAVCTPAVI